MSSSDDHPVDLTMLVNSEAWTDPQFKADLESDPNAAMARLAEKNGLQLPDGVSYQVVNNTESVQHIVLWPEVSGVAPSEEASEVQGYVAGIGDLSGGGGGVMGTTSYVCTAVWSTCSSKCPKRISSAG